MGRQIKCASPGCDNTIDSSKVALDENNEWTCQECARKAPSIGIRVLDFIKNRITVNQTEDEDRSKFVFRELVQNADDAGATILVARFQLDALYIGNDGRAFTTGPKGDFNKMSQILGRWKSDEKETAGNFGSGFQTVYALTNFPEVHSNAHSRGMNPVIQEWEFAEDVEGFEVMESPYVLGKPGHRGVLFRFEWRTDENAGITIKGFSGAPFEDASDWPRWPDDKREDFYRDLRAYVHEVIACCQSLKMIRLIWSPEITNDNGGFMEAYQVERDFTLSEIGKAQVVSISEGEGITDDDFIKSFQTDNWKWNDSSTYDYLLVADRVRDEDGKPIHMYKLKSGGSTNIEITSKKRKCEPPNCIELKKNELFILFPLFDYDSRFLDKPVERRRAYLYSVMPLPKRGPNKFIFSAHLFPAENRLDVDVDGNFGKNRVWYKMSMYSLAGLYVESVPLVLNHIMKSEQFNDSEKQRILMNTLPGASVHEWMRPGREIEEDWQEVNLKVNTAVLKLEGVFFDNGWHPFESAYLPESILEKEIVRILGAVAIGPDITSHANFKSHLNSLLGSRKFDDFKFSNLWIKRFYDVEEIEYTEKPSLNGFTKDQITKLIKYCHEESRSKSLLEQPVVPGKDRILREKAEYRCIPEELPPSLESLLPPGKLVHEDFADCITEIKTASALEIVDYISQSYEASGKKPINDYYHKVLSATLLYLVRANLNVPIAMSKFFIPYKLDGKTFLGKPNSESKPRPEAYEREWIYGFQSTEIAGLSNRVKSKIKFISLTGDKIDDDAIDEVENFFGILKLRAGTNVPTLFVRNFVSSKYGSLFDDDNLAGFLELEANNPIVEKEKRTLTKVLPTYFQKKHTETSLTPRDMGKVRCLYDRDNDWFEPNSFVISVSEELGILGYKSLHPDFQKWGESVLEALGVSEHPQMEVIIKRIKEIVDNTAQSSEEKERLLVDILIDFMIHKRSPREHKMTLKSIAWIPTSEGLLKPTEVVWPTPENMMILGKTSPFLIKIESGTPALLDKCRSLAQNEQIELIEHLKAIGVPERPVKNQMIDAVKRSMSEDVKPPASLFNSLGEISRDRELENQELGYYFDGAWYEPSKLVIRSGTQKPPDNIPFVLAVKEHGDYLRALGVTEYVSSKAILEYMERNPKAITESLWNQLALRLIEIDYAITDEFGKKMIYPIEDRLVAPSCVVIIDANLTGIFDAGGKMLIVSKEQVSGHEELLVELGATNENQLTDSDVSKIIEDVYKNLEDRHFGSDEAGLVNELISIAQRLNANLVRLLLPIEREDGNYRLYDAADCYFADDYRQLIFKHNLPILETPVSADLKEYLQDYDVNSLSEAIEDTAAQADLAGVEYTEQTSRVQQIGDALGKIYSESETILVFGWLLSAYVQRVPIVTVEYSVRIANSIETASETRQVSLSTDDERVNITVAYPATTALFDELADTIISHSVTECGDTGLEFEFHDLRNNLIKMLRTNPMEWQTWIDGFKSTDPILASFELIEEEDALFRRGYQDTREILKGWYKGCQICGMLTPRSDDKNPELQETVSSIVSRVGGVAYGHPGDYKPGNSLYLCPRHQILLKRGLIKIDDLEDAFNCESSKEAERQRLESLSKHLEELKESKKGTKKEITLDCMIFESKNSYDFRYQPNKIQFNPKHYLRMLKWIEKHLRKRLQDDIEGDWK